MLYFCQSGFPRQPVQTHWEIYVYVQFIIKCVKERLVKKNANIKYPPTSPACKYTAFKAQNYRGTERNKFLYIKKKTMKNFTKYV